MIIVATINMTSAWQQSIWQQYDNNQYDNSMTFISTTIMSETWVYTVTLTSCRVPTVALKLIRGDTVWHALTAPVVSHMIRWGFFPLLPNCPQWQAAYLYFSSMYIPWELYLHHILIPVMTMFPWTCHHCSPNETVEGKDWTRTRAKGRRTLEDKLVLLGEFVLTPAKEHGRAHADCWLWRGRALVEDSRVQNSSGWLESAGELVLVLTLVWERST